MFIFLWLEPGTKAKKKTKNEKNILNPLINYPVVL